MSRIPQAEFAFASQVRGYAYSGGGHAIIRVDVSADDGRTWTTAELEPVYDRRYRFRTSCYVACHCWPHACLPCVVVIEGIVLLANTGVDWLTWQELGMDIVAHVSESPRSKEWSHQAHV